MSQSKVQLIERLEPETFRLLESSPDSSGKKYLHFEAEVQRADTRNRNGRVYPRSVLEREVNRFKSRIADKTAFGEGDHPERSESISRQAVLWEDVRMETDGRVIGRAKVLDTAVGRDLAAILEAGGRPGISSRGSGSVTMRDYEGSKVEWVNDDYQLITFDPVVTPSVASARTSRVFVENLEETMDVKTFAELKAKFPAVYESLVGQLKDPKTLKTEMAEIHDVYLEHFTSGMTTELENLVKMREGEIRAAVVAEMEEKGELPESAEAAEATSKILAFANGVIEMAREAGLVQENITISDEEAKTAIEQLTSENEQLTSENAALTKSVAESAVKLAKIAVNEEIMKRVGDHVLAEDFAATLIESCDSIEDLDEKFETTKTRFDRLAQGVAKPKAIGKTNVSGAKEVAPIVAPLKESKSDKHEDEPRAGMSVLRHVAGVRS